METDRQEIESKVMTVLGRFASLPYITVCRMVLANGGNFSISNEQVLKNVLVNLVERRVVRPASEWACAGRMSRSCERTSGRLISRRTFRPTGDLSSLRI
jgi:hypothetical protein